MIGCSSGRSVRRDGGHAAWYHYTVRPGDTLSDIAATFGTSANRIARDNDIRDPRALAVGQVLRIRAGGTVRGHQYRVRSGDTLTAIARRHGASVETLVGVNGLSSPDRIYAGDLLLIPDVKGRIRHKAAREPSPSTEQEVVRATFGQKAKPQPPSPNRDGLGQALGNLRLRWPLDGPVKLSSPFGMRGERMHNGLDLTAPKGTPVLAAADGMVALTGTTGDPIGRSAGNYVVLLHEGTIKTLYFHNSEVLVETGETVEAGDIIARVGNTGRVDAGGNGGFHLHFEVRVGPEPRDPLLYLPPKGHVQADKK